MTNASVAKRSGKDRFYWTRSCCASVPALYLLRAGTWVTSRDDWRTTAAESTCQNPRVFHSIAKKNTSRLADTLKMRVVYSSQ
jgi:hypothetical protein